MRWFLGLTAFALLDYKTWHATMPQKEPGSLCYKALEAAGPLSAASCLL